MSDQQLLFLKAYAQRRDVRAAARAANVHRATVYRWRQSDPAFAAKWKQVDQQHRAAAMARYEHWLAEHNARRAQRLEELRPIYQANARHALACKMRRYGRRV